MTDTPRETTERAPRPGERCKCGRPAVVVFVTEKFGDVPYCGIADGGAQARRSLKLTRGRAPGATENVVGFRHSQGKRP